MAELWSAKLSLLLFDEVVLDMSLLDDVRKAYPESLPDFSLLQPTAKLGEASTSEVDLSTTHLPHIAVASYSGQFPEEWEMPEWQIQRLKVKFHDEDLVFQCQQDFYHHNYEIFRRIYHERISSDISAPIHRYTTAEFDAQMLSGGSIPADIRPLILDRVLSIPTPPLRQLTFEQIENERERPSWEGLRALVNRVASKVRSSEYSTYQELVTETDHALLAELYRDLKTRIATPGSARLGIIKGGISLIPGIGEAIAVKDLGQSIKEFFEARRNWISFTSKLEDD